MNNSPRVAAGAKKAQTDPFTGSHIVSQCKAKTTIVVSIIVISMVTQVSVYINV